VPEDAAVRVILERHPVAAGKGVAPPTRMDLLRRTMISLRSFRSRLATWKKAAGIGSNRQLDSPRKGGRLHVGL
jgi:hypothetical protein